MVVPDRDSPGITAQACATPITNASRYEISGFSIRGFMNDAKPSSSAVSSNMQPTTSNPSPNTASTQSRKNSPTMPTGTADSNSLPTIAVSSFRRKANSPRISSPISLRSTTNVLNTVATWSSVVKASISFPLFMPNSVPAIVKWPLLLTGRNSVRPWIRPSTIASASFMPPSDPCPTSSYGRPPKYRRPSV